MKKTLLVTTIVIVMSGCATQTFEITGHSDTATPQKTTMQPFFISGIGQTQTMNAAEICGGAEKVAKVETQLSFWDGLLGGLTYGIYTPRQAMVYCHQ